MNTLESKKDKALETIQSSLDKHKKTSILEVFFSAIGILEAFFKLLYYQSKSITMDIDNLNRTIFF